jgi:hypothetical protein
MRKTFCLLALSAAMSTLAFAESWSGKLIDDTCYEKQKTSTGCNATSTTTSFALDVSGKVYKLDAASNSKVTTAMKSHAERAANPNQPQSGEITAKVEGKDQGGTISADKVEIQ